MDTRSRELALLADLVFELDRAVPRTTQIMRSRGDVAPARTSIQRTRARANAAFLVADLHDRSLEWGDRIAASRKRISRSDERIDTSQARVARGDERTHANAWPKSQGRV